MALKVKAKEQLIKVGKYAETYRYVMMPELYTALAQDKVIKEAALRSGVSRGVMQACWDAAGEVIKAWATEGHSVALPGLGTMRFGLRAKSVDDVNKVKAGLITSRRIIFTPDVDLKEELAKTAVNITCYDRDGKEVKRVTSTDEGNVEDNEGENGGENTGDNNGDNNGGDNGGGNNGDNNGGGNGQLIDVAEGKMTLDAFIASLTDEDLAWLLGGQPNAGVANTFGYGNLPDFGVPNAMSADGPAGLRILPEVGVATTAFPCATLLACTWNPELAEAVGRAAGAEVKENNIAAWLAPGVNIHRNPLCGRNFEYYSEDPLLTGHMAGALIRGVQSNGVAATAKHFALNNKETNRKQSDSRASERAIREIYLRAFEIIVKQYDVWSVMTSYNLINGHRASEYADMITGVLREEWGFDGLVTTDWWTSGEHYKECAAGNDMKMGAGFPLRLLEALRVGALKRSDMELAAKHILGMILKLD